MTDTIKTNISPADIRTDRRFYNRTDENDLCKIFSKYLKKYEIIEKLKSEVIESIKSYLTEAYASKYQKFMPRLHSKYINAITKKFTKTLEKIKNSEMSEDLQTEIINSVLSKVSAELKSGDYSSAEDRKIKHIKILVTTLLADIEHILLKSNKKDYIENYKSTIKFKKEIEETKKDRVKEVLDEIDKQQTENQETINETTQNRLNALQNNNFIFNKIKLSKALAESTHSMFVVSFVLTRVNNVLTDFKKGVMKKDFNLFFKTATEFPDITKIQPKKESFYKKHKANILSTSAIGIMTTSACIGASIFGFAITAPLLAGGALYALEANMPKGWHVGTITKNAEEWMNQYSYKSKDAIRFFLPVLKPTLIDFEAFADTKIYKKLETANKKIKEAYNTISSTIGKIITPIKYLVTDVIPSLISFFNVKGILSGLFKFVKDLFKTLIKTKWISAALGSFLGVGIFSVIDEFLDKQYNENTDITDNMSEYEKIMNSITKVSPVMGFAYQVIDYFISIKGNELYSDRIADIDSDDLNGKAVIRKKDKDGKIKLFINEDIAAKLLGIDKNKDKDRARLNAFKSQISARESIENIVSNLDKLTEKLTWTNIQSEFEKYTINLSDSIKKKIDPIVKEFKELNITVNESLTSVFGPDIKDIPDLFNTKKSQTVATVLHNKLMSFGDQIYEIKKDWNLGNLLAYTGKIAAARTAGNIVGSIIGSSITGAILSAMGYQQCTLAGVLATKAVGLLFTPPGMALALIAALAGTAWYLYQKHSKNRKTVFVPGGYTVNEKLQNSYNKIAALRNRSMTKRHEQQQLNITDYFNLNSQQRRYYRLKSSFSSVGKAIDTKNFVVDITKGTNPNISKQINVIMESTINSDMMTGIKRFVEKELESLEKDFRPASGFNTYFPDYNLNLIDFFENKNFSEHTINYKLEGNKPNVMQNIYAYLVACRRLTYLQYLHKLIGLNKIDPSQLIYFWEKYGANDFLKNASNGTAYIKDNITSVKTQEGIKHTYEGTYTFADSGAHINDMQNDFAKTFSLNPDDNINKYFSFKTILENGANIFHKSSNNYLDNSVGGGYVAPSNDLLEYVNDTWWSDDRFTESIKNLPDSIVDLPPEEIKNIFNKWNDNQTKYSQIKLLELYESDAGFAGIFGEIINKFRRARNDSLLMLDKNNFPVFGHNTVIEQVLMKIAELELATNNNGNANQFLRNTWITSPDAVVRIRQADANAASELNKEAETIVENVNEEVIEQTEDMKTRTDKLEEIRKNINDLFNRIPTFWASRFIEASETKAIAYAAAGTAQQSVEPDYGMRDWFFGIK